MKTHQYTTNHSYLIWLVSFMLLLQISIGDSGRGSMPPWRNLKQTELALITSNLKSPKKSHSYFTGIGKYATRFASDLSFNSRILQHTQFAFLKWKMSEQHDLALHIKFAAAKLVHNENDDLPVLKG